ncbi:hypothetical protein FRX97_11820 [Luteibaculum oceani]|uniref:Kazal-like domain-containing protein n=2 Tax=Luteibaculum oceani TaxID=1294296 RepID=A0A5C6UQI5_9FLAO|nr:hypothetical protein FRX97_11820 [Luteibaculum oceani]
MGFKNTVKGPCVSVSKPEPSCRVEAVKRAMQKLGANCAAVWQPVCGCDGRTYSNYCYAVGNGVLVWTPGECNKVPEPVDPGTIIDVNTP